MLKRLLAAILTTTLVCTVLTYISYTPVAEQSPDTLYDSFSSILLFYVLYASPIILVSGFFTRLYHWHDHQPVIDDACLCADGCRLWDVRNRDRESSDYLFDEGCV